MKIGYDSEVDALSITFRETETMRRVELEGVGT